MSGMDPAAARQGVLKLAPVVKTNKGGGAVNNTQAQAWRDRRRNEQSKPEAVPHSQSHSPDHRPATSPDMGPRSLSRPTTEPGRSRGAQPSASVGALSLLKRNTSELFRVWGDDPSRDGRNPLLEPNRLSPPKWTKRRPNTADDLLQEHSRLLFRPVNDKCREIGTLPLRERLFLFYKRFARKMLASVVEIAEYWQDDEQVLERLLAAKYGSTLAEEGFGKTTTDMIQVQELQEQMRENRVEMSPHVRPHDEWIPQNARNVSPLALRDALLLSQAQASMPVWELDDKVREMFMRPETVTIPSTPSTSQREEDSRPATPMDSEGVLHKVALSLKEQVVTWQPTVSRTGSAAASRTPTFTLSAEQSRLPTPVQIPFRIGRLSSTGSRGGARDSAPVRLSTSSHGIPPSIVSGGDEPKEGWKQLRSATHGKPYWYNSQTGESRWLPPMSTNVLVIDSRPSSPQSLARHSRPSSPPSPTRPVGALPRPHSPLQHTPGQAVPDVLTLEDDDQASSPIAVFQEDAQGESVKRSPPSSPQSSKESMSPPRIGSALTGSESSTVHALESNAATDSRPAQRPRGMMLHRNLLPGSMANLHLAASTSPGLRRARGKGRREKRSEERILMDKAATRIQARSRGWLSRKRQAAAAESVRRTLQAVMATKIQRWFLGWLHHKQARQRKARMKANGFTIYMAHRGVVQAGKMWLSRSRARVEEEKRLAAAIKIQKHFRGMMGLRAFRKQKKAELTAAALRVQKAWRRQVEWRIFSAAEEKKAVEQAAKLRRQYLYAGKDTKQARAFREAADDTFQDATTDLGRNKAEAKLAEVHGRAAEQIGSFGMWMATLRALMKKDESEGDRQADGEASPGAKASRRGSLESAEGEKKGIAEILGFSKLTNPQAVDNAIGEQHHEHGRQLRLVGMKLLRWPFGVSDSSKGGRPWYSLRSIWLSNNMVPGLPDDFYALSNLTELRLDRNRIESLSGSLGNLTALSSLWLHSNLLRTLPPEVGKLTKLTFLSLYDNQLTALPFEICLLRDLRKLPMYGNPDCKSPPLELAERSRTSHGLVDLMHFTGRFLKAAQPPYLLNLNKFDLLYIPQIERVPMAQSIDMGNNRLAEIPDQAFYDFKFNVPWHNQLTSLNLAGNQLSVFPLAVVRLTTLTHLDISRNQIESIPVDITYLQLLIELQCDGNPMVSPTFSTLADGVETYELSGCDSNPQANGLYYKTEQEHDGTHVFELRKTHKRLPVPELQRLLLFFCDTGSRQGWYVGRELSADSALLTVNDNAARPAAVSSTWKEVSASGIFFRSATVRVKGLGLTEYLARLIALQRRKGEVTQLQEQYKVSELLYESGSGDDTSEAVTRRRALHDEIMQKRKAMVLDMSNLALSSFPPQIADTAVKTLNLDWNHLENVAQAIVEMPLTALSMRFNALTVIPKSLRRVTALQSLCLEHNCLPDLPIQLSRLHSLRTLLVSANLFQQVPAAVEHMTQLRLLDLTHNAIQALPSRLGGLLDLQDLRLKMNLLQHLNGMDEDGAGVLHKSMDSPLASLAGLTSLDLDGNRLETIPRSLRSLTLLVTVALGRNRIEDLADASQTIRAWVNLQSLTLQHNSIKLLPPRLDSLEKLTDIDLASNGLSVLPSAVISIPGLTSLSLARNFLKWLPSEIGKMTCLKRLDVSNNNIVHIAADIRLCSELETLNLSHNSLVRLPPQIGHAVVVFGKLHNLASLDISGNQLVTLPTDLLNCSSLTSLQALGNAFTHPSIIGAFVPNPPVGVVRLTIHEAAEIRSQNRSSRANPSCAVKMHQKLEAGGGKDDKRQIGEGLGAEYGETQETTMKGMTDSPVWEETLWVEVRNLVDTMALQMWDKKEGDRAIDLGYSLRLPAAFAILDNSAFLHPLGDAALIAIASAAREVQLAEGQDLASQGDELRAMVLIVHGKLAKLQRNEQGVEQCVAEVDAGASVGETCFVQGEALEHTLSALSPCLLLVVPHEALSPFLDRDPELLIDLVLWTQKQLGRDQVHNTGTAPPQARRGSVAAQPRRGSVIISEQPKRASVFQASPGPGASGKGKRHSIWGSKEWEKDRDAELVEIKQCIAAACKLHRLENNAEKKAVTTLEKRAKARMDNGGTIYDCTPKPPKPQSERMHKLGMQSAFPDKYGFHAPTISVTVMFKPGNSTTPHFQALRHIEREGGDDGMRRTKARHMAHVRSTPSGFAFDTEHDELKADDLVRRVDADMIELQAYKRSMRAQPVWEAAPRMLVVEGVFPTAPWCGANDRNRHGETNTFSGMDSLLRVMHEERRRPVDDPRPKLADLASVGTTSRGVWRRVEAELDASRRQRSALGDGSGGSVDKPVAEWRRVCPSALEGWARITGLLLAKPEWVLQKEADRPGMELQDLQLAMVRDQQELAGYREKAKWLKTKMQATLQEMEGARARIKESEKELEQGWSGAAVSKHKAAREELELMQERFDRQRKDKERVKTMFVLRKQSGAALQWRSNAAVSHVLDTFRAQANEFLDPIGALSNVQGGDIEPDMVDAIERVDFVSKVNSMTPAAVQEWAQTDELLSQSKRIQAAVVAILSRYDIDGRMLMHLDKDDLLRMGLWGPDARMTVVALAGLKKQLGVDTHKSRTQWKRYWLNAQVALLDPDVLSINALLGNELELDVKQLQGMRKAFMKEDRERTGEITWKEALQAASALGMEGNSRRIEQLKHTIEPSEAFSLDLVGFCRLGKALLSSYTALN